MVDRDVVFNKLSTIDLAAHVLASEGWGVPDTMDGGFTLLEQHGLINQQEASRLRRMVGFRNIAVHQYQELDPEILEKIVSRHLGDLRGFGRLVVERYGLAG